MSKKSKLHAEAASCDCEVCARMTNEFGEKLSVNAKALANSLGYAIAVNLQAMQGDLSEGITYTDMRSAIADGTLACFHGIVNTLLAEAFVDGKPQPTRAELLLTLRRVIEPKLLYATDRCLEGDVMQRAERDGKIVSMESATKQ